MELKWRSMESAPQDGQNVLLASKSGATSSRYHWDRIYGFWVADSFLVASFDPVAWMPVPVYEHGVTVVEP